MQFQFADCLLDTDRRELRRDNIVIPVEPQVFDLLAFVVQNRDRVVSKDDIISAIWNGRAISDSALGTRINAVRSAIGDTGKEQRLLRTLPRKGVRFIGEVTESQRPPGADAATLAVMLNRYPVFAVLPFANMSEDLEREYLADGISEDLIATISAWCRFPVIARNSSFIYKGRAIDIKQVGKELGARYIVEGSVRKSGTHLRIAAQLVDAASGLHLWADRYDREMGDLFSVQDDICSKIAAAVEYELFAAEQRRAINLKGGSLTAYDLVLRGNWHLEKYTAADLLAAKNLYEAAIDADPLYAPAYTGVAASQFWVAQMFWDSDFQKTMESAENFAIKAITLDSNDPYAQMFLGQISLFLRRYDTSISALRRSIELNPSLSRAYAILAYSYNCIGRFHDALVTVGQSLRLRPHDRTLARCLPSLAHAQYQLGNYETAEEIARRAMTINPTFWTGHQILAASLGQLKRIDDANREVAALRARYPNTSCAAFSRRLPFREDSHVEHIEDGLRKAGWID